MRNRQLLGILCLLLVDSTCHAINVEVNASLIQPSRWRETFEEFPSTLLVSEAFELQFRAEAGELDFWPVSLGGFDLLFTVEEGDRIFADTVLDYDVRSQLLLEDMPMGESLYGYVSADQFSFSVPEENLYGLYAWLRFNRDEEGFRVVESFVVEGAINGEILPVVTVGSFEACFFDSNGDLDGDGKVAFSDFLILSDNFGEDVVTHALGDIDCNGTVEFGDFLILSDNFGSGTEVANVPEPNSSFVLTLGLISFLGIRRKRISR